MHRICDPNTMKNKRLSLVLSWLWPVLKVAFRGSYGKTECPHLVSGFLATYLHSSRDPAILSVSFCNAASSFIIHLPLRLHSKLYAQERNNFQYCHVETGNSTHVILSSSLYSLKCLSPNEISYFEIKVFLLFLNCIQNIKGLSVFEEYIVLLKLCSNSSIVTLKYVHCLCKLCNNIHPIASMKRSYCILNSCFFSGIQLYPWITYFFSCLNDLSTQFA